MERWRNTLESEIYQESLIGVAMDEVHCVTEWGSSSNNKIVQLFVPFVSGVFLTLAILIMPFQRREINVISVGLRVSQVVAGANERPLYSQATVNPAVHV